jgi:hypothetical protein
MPIPFGRLAHSKGGHRMVRRARVTAVGVIAGPPMSARAATTSEPVTGNKPSSDVVPGASVCSNEVAVSAT